MSSERLSVGVAFHLSIFWDTAITERHTINVHVEVTVTVTVGLICAYVCMITFRCTFRCNQCELTGSTTDGFHPVHVHLHVHVYCVCVVCSYVYIVCIVAAPSVHRVTSRARGVSVLTSARTTGSRVATTCSSQDKMLVYDALYVTELCMAQLCYNCCY